MVIGSQSRCLHWYLCNHMVTFTAFKHMAPKRDDCTIWLVSGNNAAAFTSAICQLLLWFKARAFVGRNRIINGRAIVFFTRFFGGFQIALIYPGHRNIAIRRQVKRIKSMRNFGFILMRNIRFLKSFSPINRARKPYIAGKRLSQCFCPC